MGMVIPACHLHSPVKQQRIISRLPMVPQPSRSADQPGCQMCPHHRSPLSKEAITADKVQQVIQKCKATSIPSPVDQMSYRVFKKCPSLLPALLCLFNACWSTSSVPLQWKVGVLRLLGKEAAKTDPSVPSTSSPLP